ncbi:collagen alpha-1(I) chain-like [Rousettus aegyptiacus]|uniref:collagen alpha-1(I) chain-like n=1 Tax=Rousettus aegyptiacus TaxID=9407 RepID=UPI00168D488B|nr:collagen alpha-1(I) chain-like [Rousettus aegyptiacus]
MGTSCFERSPGPPLTGQRGFPQGHRTAAFLAGAWRCTSKKSHQLQPAAGPESVWTGALSSQAQIPSPDVPEPSTPVHKHLSGLTAEPPPPKESLASENRGPGSGAQGKELGSTQSNTVTSQEGGTQDRTYAGFKRDQREQGAQGGGTCARGSTFLQQETLWHPRPLAEQEKVNQDPREREACPLSLQPSTGPGSWWRVCLFGVSSPSQDADEGRGTLGSRAPPPQPRRLRHRERQEPSPAGSPVAPSSGFVFLRRAARPLHPGRKGKQEMPKEEGQSALERRPGPSRQFPLSQVPAPSGGGRSGVGSFHPATFSTRRLGNFLPLKSQQGKAGRPREEGSSPGPPLARPAGPRAQDGLQTGEGLAGRERPPLPPNGECLAVPSTIGGQKEPSIEGVKEPTSDGVEAAPPPGQVKRHPKVSQEFNWQSRRTKACGWPPPTPTPPL